MPPVALTLAPTPFDDPTVQDLVVRLRDELRGRYDGRDGSGALPRPGDFAPPEGAFLVALLDSCPVGCGGLVRFDSQTGEVRRMYVAPDARGAGIGRAVLGALLAAVRELGYVRVRLETGRLQHEAIRLYGRAGFTRIRCWGPYVTDERSLASSSSSSRPRA